MTFNVKGLDCWPDNVNGLLSGIDIIGVGVDVREWFWVLGGEKLTDPFLLVIAGSK